MLCSSVIIAQARNVSGSVKDKASGESLPGVAVQVESTGKGVFTDLEGKYSIEVENDQAVLIYSFVGYETQKITVGAQTTIDISLGNAKDLDEVVITALNIPRDKKSVGYATQQVDGSDVNTAKEVNIVNALQGKVAGVQITGSSNMGGSSRILIRGAKSMTGNNQPLFVVDGVPINNANFTTADQERGALGYDYGNAVQDINPNDIESVQVLKGPAAALYGSRGANGVILITTKKGKSGGAKKAIGVTVNQTYGFDKVHQHLLKHIKTPTVVDMLQKMLMDFMLPISSKDCVIAIFHVTAAGVLDWTDKMFSNGTLMIKNIILNCMGKRLHLKHIQII